MSEDVSDPRAEWTARLNRLLELCDWDQETAARRSGVAKQTISDWRRGTVPRTQAQMLQLIVPAMARLKERHESGAFVLDVQEHYLLRKARWLQTHRAARDQAKKASATRGPGPRAGAVIVADTDPLLLGVHRALPLGKSPATGGPDAEALPAYLPRPHDAELRAVLERAADPAGRGVLVILTGDSSVGKTRALWEGIRAVVPGRRLLCPGAGGLVALLKSGQATAATVLWLNETQKFLDGAEGPVAATLLAETLESTPGLIAVGAMWEDPYWRHLTALGRSPDTYAPARDLLTGARTVRIPIPDHLDSEQQRRLADLTDDPRMAAAATAGAADGKVIQHLTGGPELLAAYLDGHVSRSGGHFTPIERALITAALDARRLGVRAPLPAALLSAAADGYLRPWERPGTFAAIDAALRDLERGHRADGSRTDIRHTLTAVTPIRARTGDPATYELNDYLDQHGRHHRAETIPPATFWDAVAGAAADDLQRLAEAANSRGLLRHSAQLYKNAVRQGGPGPAFRWVGRTPASRLVHLIHHVDPDDQQAVRWVTSRTDLTQHRVVADLLHELIRVKADAQAATLAARAVDHALSTGPTAVGSLLARMRGGHEFARALALHPGAHAALTDPRTITQFLKDSRGEAPTALLAAVAAQRVHRTDLTDPDAVIRLLQALRRLKREAQVAGDMAHDPADLTDPNQSARLLSRLEHWRREEPSAHAVALADSAVHRADLTDPRAVASLLAALHQLKADAQVDRLLAATPAARTDLADTEGACQLLETLRRLKAGTQIAQVADRAVGQADLTDPSAVSYLLNTLYRLKADRQLRRLLARNPAVSVDLTDPDVLSRLLGNLRQANAETQIRRLLERNPELHTDLTDLGAVGQLLLALRGVKAHAHVAALMERTLAHGEFADPRAVSNLLTFLRGVREAALIAALMERIVDTVDLTDTGSACDLLTTMRELKAATRFVTLADRAVARIDLADASSVARLLDVLHRLKAGEQIDRLLARDPATHADLTSPGPVATLLESLHSAGAHAQIDRLLARDPGTHADLTEIGMFVNVPATLEKLRKVGAHESATELAERLPQVGRFGEYIKLGDRADRFRYGREPDGTPAPPWRWDDLD
ncbi:hypothetical protein ACIBI3_08250 [Actinomadura luteofluorescens]|uniref:hypothetical protein n=1 Tax=Actinomadura luteofluorescens TaxID=46163 RepID=UPI0034794BEA